MIGKDKPQDSDSIKLLEKSNGDTNPEDEQQSDEKQSEVPRLWINLNSAIIICVIIIVTSAFAIIAPFFPLEVSTTLLRYHSINRMP